MAESHRRGGNWMDKTTSHATDHDLVDNFHHVAKVKVTGSNPSCARRSAL
jgi:hypothetical protein